MANNSLHTNMEGDFEDGVVVPQENRRLDLGGVIQRFSMITGSYEDFLNQEVEKLSKLNNKDLENLISDLEFIISNANENAYGISFLTEKLDSFVEIQQGIPVNIDVTILDTDSPVIARAKKVLRLIQDLYSGLKAIKTNS